MKKIICLILIAIICILSACGNNQNSTKATPDEKDKDSDVTEITDNKRKDIKSIIFNFSERSEGNTCFVNGSVVVGNGTTGLAKGSTLTFGKSVIDVFNIDKVVFRFRIVTHYTVIGLKIVIEKLVSLIYLLILVVLVLLV